MKKDETKTNGKNKNDNYAITFKIDEDLADYLQKVSWVKFIEERLDFNMTQYVNYLIRKDLIELLKLDKNAKYSEIKSAWYDYKRQNNI